MKFQPVVESPDRCFLVVERHCSVCFAPIRDIATAARSQEGHHYCARCADILFKAEALDGLRCVAHRSVGKEFQTA
jgi:hypothetical protein